MSESTPSWVHLADDEQVVWEGKPHPVAMGAGVPVGVGLALVGFFLAGRGVVSDSTFVTAVGAILAVLAAALLVVQYVVWTNTRYVITSSELYAKRGVLSRNVTQFRLDRVQNTTLRESVPGRLFGYGDLVVHTAGSGDPELTFDRIPRPHRANSLLTDQLDGNPGTHAVRNV